MKTDNKKKQKNMSKNRYRVNHLRSAIIIIVGMVMLPMALRAQLTVLHEFNGTDGAPGAGNGVIFHDGTLYGATYQGGTEGNGVIYSINPDGSNFTILHDSTDRDTFRWSLENLLADGDTLYGFSFYAYNYGSIFEIGTDGSGFNVLKNFFDIGSQSGIVGTPLLIDDMLYGMTYSGYGTTEHGVIFRMRTDGSDFEVIFNFDDTTSGGTPYGSLKNVGDKLYGFTWVGGTADEGVLFSVDIDGSDFTVLHNFTGGSDYGANPKYGAPVIADGVIYGMTTRGGDNNYGVIFQINTNGTGFELMHEFTGGDDDGQEPGNQLLKDGDIFYGTTGWGGSFGDGTIFQINTDGTGFKLLHDFKDEIDGEWPFCRLSKSGNFLYGVTSQGRDYDEGTIFSFELSSGDEQLGTAFKFQ